MEFCIFANGTNINFTMPDLQLNIPQSDVDTLKDYVQEHGVRRKLRRGERLVAEGEDTGKIFFIRSGSFKCVRNDSRGRERVLALTFEGDLVANYLTARCGVPSMFNVVAMEESEGYELDIKEHTGFFERRVGDAIYVHGFVEALAYSLLSKALSLSCLSPWERLAELRNKIPDIFTRVNMQDVANYIGVSPATLSRRLAEVL